MKPEELAVLRERLATADQLQQQIRELKRQRDFVKSLRFQRAKSLAVYFTQHNVNGTENDDRIGYLIAHGHRP